MCSQWDDRTLWCNLKMIHDEWKRLQSFSLLGLSFTFLSINRARRSWISKCWSGRKLKNLGLLLDNTTKWWECIFKYASPLYIFSADIQYVTYCILFNFYNLAELKQTEWTVMYNITISIIIISGGHLGFPTVEPFCPFWFCAATTVEVRVHVFFVCWFVCVCPIPSP